MTQMKQTWKLKVPVIWQTFILFFGLTGPEIVGRVFSSTTDGNTYCTVHKLLHSEQQFYSTLMDKGQWQPSDSDTMTYDL